MLFRSGIAQGGSPTPVTRSTTTLSEFWFDAIQKYTDNFNHINSNNIILYFILKVTELQEKSNDISLNYINVSELYIYRENIVHCKRMRGRETNLNECLPGDEDILKLSTQYKLMYTFIADKLFVIDSENHELRNNVVELFNKCFKIYLIAYGYENNTFQNYNINDRNSVSIYNVFYIILSQFIINIYNIFIEYLNDNDRSEEHTSELQSRQYPRMPSSA